MIVTAVTATGTSQVASAARPRNVLQIYNQSTSATVYIAFDTVAVAAATAGQITLGPLGSGGIPASISWNSTDPTRIPQHAINMIASAGGTQVTILE
jgi:hypothetical protein